MRNDDTNEGALIMSRQQSCIGDHLATFLQIQKPQLMASSSDPYQPPIVYRAVPQIQHLELFQPPTRYPNLSGHREQGLCQR